MLKGMSPIVFVSDSKYFSEVPSVKVVIILKFACKQYCAKVFTHRSFLYILQALLSISAALAAFCSFLCQDDPTLPHSEVQALGRSVTDSAQLCLFCFFTLSGMLLLHCQCAWNLWLKNEAVDKMFSRCIARRNKIDLHFSMVKISQIMTTLHHAEMCQVFT